MSTRLITTKELVRLVRTNIHDYATLGRAAHERHHNVTVTCRAGCAYCCYQKVLVDAGQGAIIYLYLRQQGRWTPALMEALAAADKAMAPVSHHDWLATRTPCVFLKEERFGEGRCTVYPVRPIGCAATVSTAGDPPMCAVPGAKGFQALLVFDEPFKVMTDIYSNVMEAVGETEPMIMTLPAAVLYGHAMVEGLPRPDVRRIVHGAWEATGQHIEEFFDEGGPHHG